MKLTHLILLFVIIVCEQTYAQTSNPDSTQSKKVSYFFSVQSGALIGDQVTFSTSTIHGIKLGKKLRLGGGIGFDSFEDAQTIPVFGSGSWDLFGKTNVLFVQMNYGWSPFAWSPTLKEVYGFKEINGGENFSAMIGYHIASGDIRLAILAGFRRQEVKIRYDFPVYYAWSGLLPNEGPLYNTQIVNETMNRFAVCLSVGWK